MQIWKIREELYQSSKIDDLKEFEDLKPGVVIDLEGGFDDVAKVDFLYIYFHFLDAPFLPHRKTLKDVARLGFSRWCDGERVLVHCSKGMNRSSLVNGMILNLRGYPGKQAVEIITTARPGALSNLVFRVYLETLE